MSFELSALLLTWVALAVLALAMSGLLRQVRDLQMRTSSRLAIGPERGQSLAEFEEVGSIVKNGVAIFVDSSCLSCRQILPELADAAATSNGLRYWVLFRDQNTEDFTAPHVTVLSRQGPLFERLRISVTPLGVAVDSEGRVIDAKPIGSASMLKELVDLVREKEVAQ